MPVFRYDFSVPTATASVPEARRQVRKALAGFGLDAASSADASVADTALLILSELVTNSVTHAAECCSRVSVSIAVVAGHLVLAVHDRHPHIPEPREEPGDEDGRGLKLISDLTMEAGGSTEMTADPDRGGKTICIRLPLTERGRNRLPHQDGCGSRPPETPHIGAVPADPREPSARWPRSTDA